MYATTHTQFDLGVPSVTPFNERVNVHLTGLYFACSADEAEQLALAMLHVAATVRANDTSNERT